MHKDWFDNISRRTENVLEDLPYDIEMFETTKKYWFYPNVFQYDNTDDASLDKR